MNLENLAEFEHLYNPLHMYCRLRELKIKKEDCVDLCVYYNDVFYEPLIKILKYSKPKDI